MLCHKVMYLFYTEPFTCELIPKRHSLSCHYKWTITITSHKVTKRLRTMSFSAPFCARLAKGANSFQASVSHDPTSPCKIPSQSFITPDKSDFVWPQYMSLAYKNPNASNIFGGQRHKLWGYNSIYIIMSDCSMRMDMTLHKAEQELVSLMITGWILSCCCAVKWLWHNKINVIIFFSIYYNVLA